MALYFLVTALTLGLAGRIESRSRLLREGMGGLPPTRRRAFNAVLLTAVFGILAGLAALRLEVGNDYGKYVESFHEIWAGTDQAYVVTEAGFNGIVRLLYSLSGYENYLLVFALFGAATTFLFLKAMYEESESFAGSFAMFMLLGLYFRTFTTVRYYLALAAALYCLRFLRRRQYGCFVLGICLAALFHRSVLAVLPLYLLAHAERPVWLKKGLLRVSAAAGIGALLLRGPLLELALVWYPTYRDTVYLTQDVGLLANLPGVIRCLLVFALALLAGRESRERGENPFYLRLNFFGLLFYTCGSFLPLVSRLAYFAVTPQILLVPGLLAGIGDKKRRRILTAAVGLVCFGYFLWFLHAASGGGIRVLPYRTWIFTDKEWINGADFF
ncbi:MAG: EpsG family protein [Eubacteriales bacterium]|nr:EpsG family protein [Eubacteriales bacterium]